MRTLFFCLLAAVFLAGCSSSTQPEEAIPGQIRLKFFHEQNGRIMPMVQSDPGWEIYSNFASRVWFWERPDSFSFSGFSLINYYVCLAEAGANGQMLDSLFIQTDQSDQMQMLRTHLTGPDGNFFRFWVDQDGTVKNPGSTTEVYWIDFFYVGLSGVSHKGTLTNWSQRTSWWPASAPADILVLLMNGQEELPFDSRWYVVSRTKPYPDGTAIDTVFITQSMLWPPDSTVRRFPMVRLLSGGHFQD
jgi:hypothetical protein